MDTGLACHLLGWPSPKTLERGAMSGQMFGTFMVGEVLKSYMNSGANPRDVWFCRDSKQRETDLVIQDGRILHPVEIKKKAAPSGDDISSISALQNLADYEVGEGTVICQTDKPHCITRDVQAVPVWSI